MLYWPSPQEGIAWLLATDESWADRAATAYDTARTRDDDTPDPPDT